MASKCALQFHIIKLPLHRIQVSGILMELENILKKVVRVSGYRSRGPGFYSWRFQIF
jgi:hypothetical protein